MHVWGSEAASHCWAFILLVFILPQLSPACGCNNEIYNGGQTTKISHFSWTTLALHFGLDCWRLGASAPWLGNHHPNQTKHTSIKSRIIATTKIWHQDNNRLIIAQVEVVCIIQSSCWKKNANLILFFAENLTNRS